MVCNDEIFCQYIMTRESLERSALVPFPKSENKKRKPKLELDLLELLGMIIITPKLHTTEYVSMYLFKCVSMYLSKYVSMYLFIKPSHKLELLKVSFLVEFNRFEFRDFLSPRPINTLRLKSPVCPIIFPWRENSWIDTFPKGISIT